MTHAFDAANYLTGGQHLPLSSNNKFSNMQKTIKLKSVKILKQREGDGATIDVIESDDKGDTATGPRDHTAPVHPDLVAKILKLTAHYALLTGVIPAQSIPSGAYKDFELEDRVYVSGISLSNRSKTEGFMITGHFYNFREKAVIANTPWEAFGSDEGYPLIDEVGTIFNEIQAEVLAYLDGSKRGTPTKPPPAKQGSLDVDDKGQASGNTYPQGQSHASPEAQKRVAEDPALKEKPAKRGREQTAENPAGT
jgi:hypothetical protein